jgi:DNA-binding transcriptional LysR family regulator
LFCYEGFIDFKDTFEKLMILIYLLIIMMDLKYDDLQAFLQVYQAGTFTAAAKENGLTQSALSQKIARLEEILNAALFVRHPRKLTLTASGEKVLVYAKEISQRQTDFLSSFDQYNTELSGVIRIASFSSVMRSIIFPKISSFMRNNPSISIELSTYEMHELEDVLKTNRSDLIITDYFPSTAGLEKVQINEEEYVIIKSKKHKNIPNTYIDHGPFDNATESYFKHINRKVTYSRLFLGDVYSIIDGVEQGLGYAVMSKHLIEDNKSFVIEANKKKYIRPVVLSYFKQNYYSPLFEKVIDLLES